jgi:hypothetical protein
MRILHEINRARHARTLQLNALPPSPFIEAMPAAGAGGHRRRHYDDDDGHE